MARVSFKRTENASKSPHQMTIKEARYIRNFKNLRLLAILLLIISIVEAILIHRGS
jgi:hypothetical protein